SGRGGKSSARPPRQSPLCPLARFHPHQKPVAQPHRERMARKPLPAPPLILIPAQLRFRFLMILLHPVAARGILDQHGQRRVCREATPEILPVPLLPPSGTLPEQPADVAGAIPIHPPAAQGEKLG